MSASHKPSKKQGGEVKPPAKQARVNRSILMLAGILILGLAIRLLPVLFTIAGSHITFLGPDSYYHMRRTVYTVYHYPVTNVFDSYVNYPPGFMIGWPPLFDIITATSALIMGLGHPDIFTIELASSLVPVLMGVASIALAYYLIRDAINEKTALVAALIMAILPAAIFRSLFGVVDHHILEVLTSLAMFLLFMRAVSGAKKAGLSVSSLRHPRPIIYSMLAGIAIACMVFSWDGAPIFIGVIVAYAFIQYAYDAFNKERSDYLTVVGVIASAVAFVLVAPYIAISQAGQMLLFNAYLLSMFHVVYLLGLCAFFPAMGLLSGILHKRSAPWYSLPAISIILAAIAGAMIKSAMPAFFKNIETGALYLLGMDQVMSTISEVESLFMSGGHFSTEVAWAYFSFAGILAVMGLIAYILTLKGRKVENVEVFLLVWTVIVLGLGILQKRFIYLLAVNASVFGGFMIYYALELAGLDQYLRPSAKKKASGSRSGDISPALIGVFAVLLLLMLPVLLNSLMLAFTPEMNGADWVDACTWVKDNTPQTSFLYSADNGTKPEYGVMSWWDYGNYILYEAGRPVVANNFQTGVEDAARFFTASDEASANAVMDNRSARYVMLDYHMGTPFAGVSYGIFENMALLAGDDPMSYHDNIPGGKVQANIKYYNTMYARLFSGDGCGINATGCDPDGLSHYRLLYTTRGDDPVKVFEYVKGASIVGKAVPGTTVKLQLKLASPYGENTYYQESEADTDGTYAFVVPYPTSGSSFITTGNEYALTCGSTVSRVQVPESAVTDGTTILAN